MPLFARLLRCRCNLSVLAFLLLIFQQRLEAGSGFTASPLVNNQQQRFWGQSSIQLQYKTDANNFDSSSLTNATTSSPSPPISKKSTAANGGATTTNSTTTNGDTKPWNSAAEAGTLGDIMSRNSRNTPPKASLSEQVDQRDGLVTSSMSFSSGTTLASRFGIEHPLDRMALTANGNLQRLVSSYYDAPVEVLVDYCNAIDGDSQAKQWDRRVHLVVHNQTFCTAHSIITVYDPLCQELVESGKIGIGQLFRYLDILPEFELRNAGPYPQETGGGFWREYTLKCAELSCFIHEDFRQGIWDIPPPPKTSS